MAPMRILLVNLTLFISVAPHRPQSITLLVTQMCSYRLKIKANLSLYKPWRHKKQWRQIPLISEPKYHRGSFHSHASAALLSRRSTIFALKGRLSKPHRRSVRFRHLLSRMGLELGVLRFVDELLEDTKSNWGSIYNSAFCFQAYF